MRFFLKKNVFINVCRSGLCWLGLGFIFCGDYFILMILLGLTRVGGMCDSVMDGVFLFFIFLQMYIKLS